MGERRLRLVHYSAGALCVAAVLTTIGAATTARAPWSRATQLEETTADGAGFRDWAGLSRRLVDVVSRRPAAEMRCGGVAISRSWVITARHCIAETSSTLVTLNGGHTLEADLIVPHATHDLGLVRVRGDTGVEAAVIAGGVVVQCFGAIEHAGLVRWVRATPRRRLDNHRVVMRLDSGACAGDSGRPLVSEHGALVGILSRGSPQCSGDEEYALLAPEKAWLDSIAALAR